MKYYVCDRCREEITRSDMHYVVHMQEVSWESGTKKWHFELCDDCWHVVANVLSEPARP